MSVLEIVLQRKSGETWPVFANHTPPGQIFSTRSEGEFSLDLGELNACALPADYGEMLGQALFRGMVRDSFVDALGQARAGEEALHVFLTVEDRELRMLHWERLCAPFGGTWDFLSLNQQTPFSFYLPSFSGRHFPPIARRDLRALLLVAGKEDLQDDYALVPLDIAGLVQMVRQSMGEIACDVLASRGSGAPGEQIVGSPDLNTLCERLSTGGYTMLHIVCHGQYHAPSRETMLFFPGDGGRPVTASELIRRLNRLNGARGLPHFAFLMACESARPEAENGFGGLGQRLVRELGFPAVLAMTDPITIATANVLVRGFYSRLLAHGQPDRALGEALAGSMGRVDVNVPAVFSRLGGQPLFREELERALSPLEVSQSLQNLSRLVSERAPVLLPNFERVVVRLNELSAQERLGPAQQTELAAALEQVDLVSEETLGLDFHSFVAAKSLPLYDARCPFRGLEPFRVEDHEFFFGREALVQKLAARLEEHPFLAVLGPSGSGKSSLVLAGLVPASCCGTPAIFTPGGNPLERLDSALAGAGPGAMVVIDQFEELFTLCPPAQREAFIERVLALPAARRVVITMRADFWGECAPYKALREQMQAHQELVGPMDIAELRRAIEQQAAGVGLRFEVDLAETILDDVQSEPGAMPLLQHALLLLWQRRHGRWLYTSEYRGFGGVREAIAHTAEEIFNQLSAPDRERMRGIFIRLTHLDEDATPGIERRDTRRRVGVNELVPAGSERVETLDLVRRLADARLVITGTNLVNGRDEVEVAHEALIQHWPRLRRWLDEDRATLRVGEAVREAANEWQAGKSDESLLVHRGGRLEDALYLVSAKDFTFNQLEIDYLNACRDLLERERRSRERLRRILLAAALAVAVVMAALAGWGMNRAGEAGRQAMLAGESLVLSQQRGTEAALQAATASAERDRAEQQATIAANERDRAERQGQISLARQLAAQAQRFALVDPPRAALLAMESWRISPELETNLVLSNALEKMPRVVARMAHEREIVSIAISPDGKQVVTGSDDGTARVWETASGRKLLQLGHSDRVWQVVFSPDGKWIATASRDGTARVWDAVTGKEITRVDFGSSVISIAFSPDGQRVASGGRDGTGRVWETLTGKELARFTNSEAVGPLTFSPDGKWILSGSKDYSLFVMPRKYPVTVWEVSSGKAIFNYYHDSEVTAVAFSPDGQRIASSSQDGTAVVCDPLSGAVVSQIRLKESVNSVGFSPDGSLVVSASSDKSVQVWAAESGERVGTFAHDDAVMQAVFSPDGQKILSVSRDRTARVWSLADNMQISHAALDGAGTAAAFLPDGAEFVSGSENGAILAAETLPRMEVLRFVIKKLSRNMPLNLNGFIVQPSDEKATITTEVIGPIRDNIVVNDAFGEVSLAASADRKWIADSAGSEIIVWEAASNRIAAQVRLDDYISDAVFHPNGKWLLVGSYEGAARMLEIEGGNEVARFLHPDTVYGVAISPDGAMAATAGTGGVRVWDIASGKEIARFDEEQIITRVSFGMDGKQLLISSSGNPVATLVDIAASQEPIRLVHGDGVYVARYSPDGKSVLTGSWDRTARVWDAATGREISRMVHEDGVWAIAFSPDGKWVLSGGDDRTARVWDAASGEETARVNLNERVVRAGFSRDGKWIVAGGLSGAVRVVLWRPEDLAKLACEQLDRNLTAAQWQQYFLDTPYHATCPDLAAGE